MSQIASRLSSRLAHKKEAEIFLLNAFTSRYETTEGQIEILSWFRHIDSGMFRRTSGLAKPEEDIISKSMIPLLPYANALGYKLIKDSKTGESVLIKCDFKWVIKLNDGEELLLINHQYYRDIKVENDNEKGFMVNPSVIALLLADKYGEGMKNQLSLLFKKVE